MTTYELPPEPPIGSRVVDNRGISWKRERFGADYGWDSLHMSGKCWNTLLKDGPLTLIEPEPWPTHELIVADWTSGGVEGGRGLLYRETGTDQYWTIRENESVYPEHPDDTLTNVVPVRVVPVANLDALARASRAVGSPGLPDSLQDRVIRLLEATDALGATESGRRSRNGHRVLG